MPEYLSPAVYIEEIPGAKPIEGVGTSTGAFVGIAEKGPVNDPQLITNFSQFKEKFGGFLPDAHLAYAVQHFFTEGGTRCYVVRAFRPRSDDPKSDVAKIEMHVSPSPIDRIVMEVYASSPGTWGNNVSVRVEEPGFAPDNPQTDPNDPATINPKKRFKLKVFYKQDIETFDQLSMAEFIDSTNFPNRNHVEKKINGFSKYIKVRDVTDDRAIIDPPFLRQKTDPDRDSLAGGTDGAAPGTALTDLLPIALIGGPATPTEHATGLFAFDTIDDINIVAIPDLVNTAFDVSAARNGMLAAITYCNNRKDCFFVADAPDSLSPQKVLEYKQGTDPSGNAFNSKNAALYYPWIYITDETGNRKLFPPSGAIVGSYSASDVRIGVHKAPAGIEDGYLNSAVGVERVITKGEHDTLNPEGINVIRKFTDAGIVIWGARTVSSDSEWKYVNVRRLFLFLEESILKGTQGVVFEPNDRTLWKRIVRDVKAFLRIQWREGKLVGDKEDDAFRVQCDEETNPQESIDLGRVITLIGVAPSKPAEFVIFRISQSSGGSTVEE